MSSLTSIHWADGTNSPKVFPPDSEPYGFTLEEWAEKSWQRIFSMSSAFEGEQDEGDADNSCAINQNGPVWHLGGTTGEGGSVKRVCTIPTGKAVLYPVITGACTYADTPNAKSDTELRSCAMAGDEGALIEMSIDGIKLEDINRYRVQSPPFDTVIPEENAFGISPGPTRGVADCWCVMIEPLPVGRHVIKHAISIPGNPTIGLSAFAADTTYDLIVQEQQFAVTPYAISVGGSEEDIILPINSSSNVSDFRFNEQTKQISFKVSSEADNVGIVMLPVSRALEGPYTVTFDGNVMTNPEIFNNQTSNEPSIEITHNRGIHAITITGTTVIPEFPTSLVSVLILGVALGVIISLSRRQYITSK